MNSYEENYGIKELNSITVRAYSDLTVGNKHYEAGEPVFYLDKVQLAQLSQNKRTVAARGGWKNLPRVVWTDFYDLKFQFLNGLVSKKSMRFFTESGAIEHGENEKSIRINKKEEVEVKNGKISLQKKPLLEKLFIYTLDDGGNIGTRISDYTVDDKKITLTGIANNTTLLVDYYFEYTSSYTNYKVIDKEMEGCFSIEGYTDIKNEETGLIQTYFFEIPKAKITSNLEMNLGEKANPVLSAFDATGLPVERDGETIICDMYLLDEDVMSDI